MNESLDTDVLGGAVGLAEPSADPGAAEAPVTTVDRVCEHVALRAPDHHRAGTFDHRAWRDLAALGFWRAGVPAALGGHGGTWMDLAEQLEHVASRCRDLGFVLSMIAHAGLVRALVEYGTDHQRAHWLPPLLEGDVGATAITETGGGSDVARVATAAQEQPDGYRLTGTKDHITNAPVADRALVVGRVPALGRRDITLFLVRLDQPGVARGPHEDLLGNRTSPTGRLDFDGAVVPLTDVLGTPGEGLATLYQVISFDRVLYGIVAAAYLEPMLEDVLRFAEERESCRQPIVEHQFVQYRLTEIRVGIDVTRAVSRTALAQLVAGEPTANMACSVAKLVGSESLVDSARHLMCLYGHRAYEDGFVAKSLRDALGTLIAGGTSEMQRKNILSQMRSLTR